MSYYRKVIRITAEDSPNVKHARKQLELGFEPDNTIILPGVLPWADYQKRLKVWDEVRQCIGLFAQFYKGAEILMYPPDWLNRAAAIATSLRSTPRQAKAIGIDPGEGGDDTAWAVVDEFGLMHMEALSTVDTSVIADRTKALARRFRVAPVNCVFDAGGGGTQIANQMRKEGWKVKTVGFGEAVAPPIRRGGVTIKTRIDESEQRYTYLNRRAEMYGMLRNLLDPSVLRTPQGFGIPSQYKELRRQLGKMPLLYDKEGRLRMLPKRNTAKNSSMACLVDILGCSPDEADSLVLAVYGMLTKSTKRKVGAF